MPNQRVVLLTGDGKSGRIAARYLSARFGDFSIVKERSEPAGVFIHRRLKRFGALTLAGQIAFMVVQRLLRSRARQRVDAIGREHNLDPNIPRTVPVAQVDSVNAAECIDHLKRLDPAVVLVVGTRIIGDHVLSSISAPFINYHAGITPKYRGVHGGYWALVEGDKENCGSTVHLVDRGIDTGGILYQARIAPTRGDNFATYPYLQLAAALPMLEKAARDAVAGQLAPQPARLPSRLWSHPTIWSYLANGLRRGVW